MAECPKRMTFGPCGGVRPDGTCEMTPKPCVFPDPVLPSDARQVRGPTAVTPLVLADVSVPPFEPAALDAAARTMAASCDAVLVGEHHNRPDFPPTVVAGRLLSAGARPWITLACRDRNRVVLEQELRGLKLVGVDTVLCVTGDGRGPDVRPEVTQVWDLDGPRLASLAAEVGLVAAVPETPTAPPLAARARRLVGKQHLGAGVAVLNHVARPVDVSRFVAAARTVGLTIPILAAVAVFTDEASANALQALPGLDLDPAAVAAVLDARDPIEAGVEVAVAEAEALLAIDGVVGVNLSGAATSRGWELGARVKAEVGARVQAGGAQP